MLVAGEDQDLVFLMFRWKGMLYQFICFPNGHTSAPVKFTKLLKSVLAYIRLQGFTNAFYIDDTFLQGSHCRVECTENLQEMRSLLTRLVFIINEKRSVVVPNT